MKMNKYKCCIILVLLSIGKYVNTDHIVMLDDKYNYITIMWCDYLPREMKLDKEDMQKLKRAMGVFG